MRRIIPEIILMSVIFIIIPWLFLPDNNAAPGLPLFTIAYVGIALPQIGLVVWLLKRSAHPLSACGWRRPTPRTAAWLGVCLAGAAVIAGAGAGLLYLILGDRAAGVLFQRQLGPTLTPIQIPFLVLFCLAVGYREEAFFRSYLITRLGDLGVKPVWAVTGSALIFGAAHFAEGVFGMATAGLVGAFFGLVFIKTRQIHALAGAHALYNLGVWLLGYFLVKV